MSDPRRILVFEASALLSTLAFFTDPDTSRCDVLNGLLTPRRPGEEAPLDKLVIPDHIFYELTGVLPISFPYMLHVLSDAYAKREEDGGAALDSLVAIYSAASPRGEGAPNYARQKAHVRALLYFVAEHPDALMETETAKAYCDRMTADYSVLGTPAMLAPATATTPADYCPTFADAFTHLGDAFQADGLRVHAGQLWMLGLMNEDQYNARISREETAMARKQRFYLLPEFLQLLNQNHRTRTRPYVTPPHPQRQEIWQQAAAIMGGLQKDMDSVRPAEGENHYLTLGFLRRHPELLALNASYYGRIEDAPAEQSDRFKAGVGPSRLLMEHYLFSGILPPNIEPLRIAAQTLGFDPGTADDADMMRHTLYQQGFLEMRPTFGQLKLVLAACETAGIECPTLRRFTGALGQAQHAHTERFRAACHGYRNGGLANQKDLRLPETGIPYEKTFADPLINGTLRWEHFWSVVTASGGLKRGHEGYWSTDHNDLLVEEGPTPEQTYVYVAQKGFVSRNGMNGLDDYLQGAACTRHIDGQSRRYYRLPVNEWLDRARYRFVHRTGGDKLYRMFEAMLYKPAARYPDRLRVAAMDVLTDDHATGESRVLQMEKDFTNRYSRKSNAVEPPYASPMAAMQLSSRQSRKNLGEVATLEAASSVLAQYPQAHVWLGNHDSDLKRGEMQDDLQLGADVVRQHAGLHPVVRQLNASVQGQSHLHFLNTRQLIESLRRLTGMEPLTPGRQYDHLKMTLEVAQLRSGSWSRVVEPVITGAQR